MGSYQQIQKCNTLFIIISRIHIQEENSNSSGKNAIMEGGGSMKIIVGWFFTCFCCEKQMLYLFIIMNTWNFPYNAFGQVSIQKCPKILNVKVKMRKHVPTCEKNSLNKCLGRVSEKSTLICKHREEYQKRKFRKGGRPWKMCLISGYYNVQRWGIFSIFNALWVRGGTLRAQFNPIP